MEKTFIIEDWMSNRLFPTKTFTSFEDGWAYIYKNVDNSTFDMSQNDDDDEYQEYFVIEIK
jgi:hypothetical protein